MGALAC